MADADVKKSEIEKVPVRMGVMPQSIEEGWRLAVLMAKSELVPSSFRGKPEDILVAIQMGAEIGFAPMQALQSIAVVNGRPAVWGDGLLALVMSSPLYRDHTEYFEVDGKGKPTLSSDDLKKDSTAAVCTFLRRGKDTPVQRSFTIGQAKRASLLTKPGAWSTFPDRMLAMRARGFAARDAFPDLLRGIKTAEELQDVPPDDSTKPYVVRRASDVEDQLQPASSDLQTLGPVQIRSVDPESGEVQLSDSVTVIAEGDDKGELKKFAGTDHQLRLTVVKHHTDGRFYIDGFELVD